MPNPSLLDLNDTSNRDICQFFSMPNPSPEETMFLLVARRSGRTKAKQIAIELGWKCEAAIRAVDLLAS